MNFKALAASALVATTALFSGGAAEASVYDEAKAIVDRHVASSQAAYERGDYASMCRSEGTMIRMQEIAPGVLTDSYEAQTRKNIRICKSNGYSVAPVEDIDVASDAEMDALFGVLFGEGDRVAAGMTRGEATNWCRYERNGSFVRPEVGTYGGQTGKWECVSHTGATAGVVRMK